MPISQQREASSLQQPNAPTAHRAELVRIAKGTTLVSIATFFGLGLTHVYKIFLARYLSAEVYGLYAIGLAVFNMLSVIALAGLDSATLRFVPTCLAKGDEMGVRRTIRTILGVSLAFGSLLGSALLLASDVVAVKVFQNPEVARVLKIFALGIPAYTASSVLICTLQAFQEVRWRTFVKYISEPVAKVILTVGLLWAGWNLDAASIAFVVALALSTVLALVPLRHLFSPWQAGAPSPFSVSTVLTHSTPLLAALLVNSMAVKADVLLLGYWQSAKEVGVYSAAFQTAAIMALILQSFQSIGVPFLSESIARNDKAQIDKLYKVLLRWVLTFSLPLFLVMALFPRDILALFGKSFENGALCLVILAIGQILNAGTGSAHHVLLLAGHTKLVMWNTLLVGILQIGLNLVLISRYGMVGTAIAASTSLVLVNIVRIAEGFWLLGVQPYEWIVWKPIAASIGTSLLIWVLKEWLQVRSLSFLMCAVVIAYFASLIALGLDDDDVAVLYEVRRRVQRLVGVFG